MKCQSYRSSSPPVGICVKNDHKSAFSNEREYLGMVTRLPKNFRNFHSSVKAVK